MKILSETLFKNERKTILYLLLPAIILFLKSLGFEFTTLDEQWMILKNGSFLGKWGSVKDAFTKPITESYYRPLLMTSFIIDYHLGKLSPFIYHFTNLILHLVSVYLLFRFLLTCSVGKKTAFIFSVIFSIHPMVVHAVAWIPGRNDLLLCVFSLLSLINLNKFISQQKLKFFLVHLLFFACALASKENAIVLPVIFFFVCITASKERNRMLGVNILSWIILSALLLIIRNQVISSSVSFSLSGNGIKDFFLAFVIFGGKTILPVYQSILPKVTASSVVVSLIGLAIVIGFTIKLGVKDKKMALLGLTIFVVLLIIPVWFGAVKPGGEQYEHRSYTSLAGFMLFLSQIRIDFESKTLQNILLLMFCMIFIKSFTRLKVYKNPQLFMEAGIKERPDYYLFYQQKGEALYRQRKFNEANGLFTKAIKLRPDKAELYSNRGSSEFSMRMYPEAIKDLTEAITKSEFKMEYYLNRCIVYNRVGDIQNALKDYSILKKCCSDKIPIALRRDLDGKSIKKPSN